MSRVYGWCINPYVCLVGYLSAQPLKDRPITLLWNSPERQEILNLTILTDQNIKMSLYSLNMGLATGLAIFSIKKGKSHLKMASPNGTCHFVVKKMASPMGLAILRVQEWQVPGDLPFCEFKNGKSHGTCPFQRNERASPMDCPFSYIKKEQSHGTAHFLISKRSSPMGLLFFVTP